jgi:hypothetical protein
MRDEGKPGSDRVDLRVRTTPFALRVIRLFSVPQELNGFFFEFAPRRSARA